MFVAVAGAAGSVILAATTFLLNARHTAKDRLSQRKLDRYTELLTAISDLAVKGVSEATNTRYATAANTIVLTAPQAVVDALFTFQQEITISNPKRSIDEHDTLLTELVLQIRKSLELPFKDDPSTFKFKLVGPATNPSQPIE